LRRERDLKTAFDLLLFSVDPSLIASAVAGGVRGVVVDWERAGKQQRQSGLDTQINNHTVADLLRVRHSTDSLVICRINGYGATTPAEIDRAIDGGADEILLPMVQSVEEVESVLTLVQERCGVGILVETVLATELVSELSQLPLCRVLLGLIDLAIERKSSNIFEPVIDGTVEDIRESFDIAFGWGGLTLPNRGHPIPCRLLIGEMVRLQSDFSFLRRSFIRDIDGRDPSEEVARLLEAIEQARSRPAHLVAEQADEFRLAVSSKSDGMARAAKS
jgi:hypothetical protein